MNLPVIDIVPFLHQGKLYWKLWFRENIALHEYLKQAEGVKYSHTYGSLVTYATSDQYHLLEKHLQGKAVLKLTD